MTIALWQRPLARVVAGIVRANDGALFDPSDLSTLYQDAAGTTPVTAVEQPVGLMLDKSRGLMLGPELIKAANWSWLATGVVNNNGVFTLTSVTTALAAQQAVITKGITYQVSFTIDSISSGGVSLTLEGGTATTPTYTTAGTYTAKLTATATGQIFIYCRTAPLTAVISGITVKQLYGYHATQSITASRPTLSARYNLLTKTEDLSDAAWDKDYCTVATNTTTDPFGGTSADTITSSSSTTNAFIHQAVPAMISGATYTASRYVKAGSVTKCTLGIHALADVYFDLDALTYNVIGAGFVSGSIVDVGNGWRKITASWVWSGTICRVYFALAATMSSQSGVPVGDYLYSFGHSLVLGTTPGPYQRVNTSTDYDTDPRYFPKYLRFDGVDDYLNLPYMGLYAAGSASVVVAGRTSKQWGVVISEGSTTSGSPQFAPLLTTTATSDTVGVIRDDNNGNVLLHYNTSMFDKVSVVSSIISASDSKAYRDSVFKTALGYTRSTPVTMNTTVIGARVSTSVVEFLGGNIYGLIVTKSALTDSQRVACERYLGRKSGVQL